MMTGPILSPLVGVGGGGVGVGGGGGCGFWGGGVRRLVVDIFLWFGVGGGWGRVIFLVGGWGCGGGGEGGRWDELGVCWVGGEEAIWRGGEGWRASGFPDSNASMKRRLKVSSCGGVPIFSDAGTGEGD